MVLYGFINYWYVFDTFLNKTDFMGNANQILAYNYW
jgi:hypothetical protein